MRVTGQLQLGAFFNELNHDYDFLLLQSCKTADPKAQHYIEGALSYNRAMALSKGRGVCCEEGIE